MTTATAHKPKPRKPRTTAKAQPPTIEPNRYTIPTRYTPGQLVQLHAMTTAEPTALFVVRGFAGAEFTGRTWLIWFVAQLTEKINRQEPGRGKGHRAARRLATIRNEKAECKWCGQLTGSTTKRFCEMSCARAYNG